MTRPGQPPETGSTAVDVVLLVLQIDGWIITDDRHSVTAHQMTTAVQQTLLAVVTAVTDLTPGEPRVRENLLSSVAALRSIGPVDDDEISSAAFNWKVDLMQALKGSGWLNP